MSMKATRPHRVKCKTCKDVHAYRVSEPGTKKAKTTRTTRKTASTRVTRASEYDKLMDGRDVAGATAYKITGKFNPDELINHKKFGLGVVMRQVDPTKVEVLFSDGLKLMICGR